MATNTSMNMTGGAQQDALNVVKTLLDQYGLSSLAMWAWAQITQGASPNEILQNLRQTNDYKTRFAGLIERESKGLSPMSESDAIAYEKAAGELFHASGLPAGFYDQSADFQKLIGGDVSISELTNRVNQGYMRVVDAPVQVQQAYQQLFGPSGDAALASMFLDPDKALPALEQQAAAAEYAGTGMQYGFPISRQRSLEAGLAGLTASQVQSGFGKLNDMRAIFSPTVSEANAAQAGGPTPVNAEQGQAAIFGLGDQAGAANQVLNQQQLERQAAMGGGGGVQVGKGGLVGLGTSGQRNN